MNIEQENILVHDVLHVLHWMEFLPCFLISLYKKDDDDLLLLVFRTPCIVKVILERTNKIILCNFPQ